MRNARRGASRVWKRLVHSSKWYRVHRPAKSARNLQDHPLKRFCSVAGGLSTRTVRGMHVGVYFKRELSWPNGLWYVVVYFSSSRGLWPGRAHTSSHGRRMKRVSKICREVSDQTCECECLCIMYILNVIPRPHDSLPSVAFVKSSNISAFS